jgi:signal transduction histidine kinase
MSSNAGQIRSGETAGRPRFAPVRGPRALLATAGASVPSALAQCDAGWAALRLSRHARAGVILLAGCLGAAGVGYVVAENPYAAPVHAAILVRVAIIMSLILAGTYALGDPAQRRLGRLLVAAGFFSCLWLLNGSSRSLAFSAGAACTGIAAPLFYYLLLAHPGGRVHSSTERFFVATISLVLFGCWEFCWLTSVHPPIATPLLRCAPHCPPNAFFLGGSPATPAATALYRIASVLAAGGTFLLLMARLRLASAPLRRSLMPTALVATFSLLFLLGFLVDPTPKTHTAEVFGYLHFASAAAIPLAILLGLCLERQFMGQALARFVDQLAGVTPSRVQALMADVLHDPSLTIAYRRPTRGTYVDHTGAAVQMPAPGGARAVAEIERDGQPVASVFYDGELADQAPFVHAAGAAAALRLQELQLEADLKASLGDLARSRRRLVEAADAERQRIERDLHDGAQQHLVGMRVKLELARDAMRHDAARGERMLTEIGDELDEAFDELRSLAQGVYPPLLAEHGLAEALKSAARRAPIAISVRATCVGRYPADVETAVYFCCREALQNAAKHGEHGARLILWEYGTQLHFEVSDSGPGFDPMRTALGHGIVNMRDRVEAIGGTLSVSSHVGSGTVISGVVPVRSSDARARPR